MAIPTDYVFQSGTVQKSGVYQFIIDKMKAAGWTDISSNPTTDFVVLKSIGNTGDKNLLIQLRPGNASSNTNSTVTTPYCQMSYRLIDSYTPGAAGVAGVFGRSALVWTDLYTCPVPASTQIAMDAVLNYKYYADTSKLILSLEYPGALGYNPMLIYIGQPDSSYVTESGSAGMLVATTATSAVAASVHIDNTPDGAGAVTAPYGLATQSLLPGNNPNNANKYAFSDIYYGNATEGIRGKLDGVFCMMNKNVLTGDNIISGSQTFYVVVCHTIGSTSFPTQALLFRIS